MAERLFLLAGMALVYRAHFAFIRRPIFTSKGINTSALFGFTQTLLDILTGQQPTHLAVAFDTGRTFRDDLFAEYKGTRAKMPDELRAQIERIRQLVDAFNIPRLEIEGYEADDVLGQRSAQGGQGR